MVWDIFNLEGETPVNGSFCLFLRTMFWNFDVNINSFVEINVSVAIQCFHSDVIWREIFIWIYE